MMDSQTSKSATVEQDPNDMGFWTPPTAQTTMNNEWEDPLNFDAFALMDAASTTPTLPKYYDNHGNYGNHGNSDENESANENSQGEEDD